MKTGITNFQFYLMLLHLLCNIFWVNAQPLVKTPQGTLRGINQKSRSGITYSAFLGIPYGLAPIKNLRFANPVEAGNWTGIRAADSFGSACIQIDQSSKITGAEDCLYLNVYTPLLNFNSSLSQNALLPVMVWIHGGSFVVGTGNSYGAQYLLDKRVILVTINFRLGIFGFLSTGDSAASGNFGMKDQVLALKWVQKYIKYFGGDSKRVTIFGQSTGGASVALHAISKASAGLFQKYIILSGANLFPWGYQRRSKFIEYTKAIAPLVNCTLTTSARLLACLRQSSPESLLKTTSIFSTALRLLLLTWTPTDEPDSKDSFLTDSPINLISNNKITDLPFISGVVTGEGLIVGLGRTSIDDIYNLYSVNLDPVIDFIGSYYDKPLNLTKFRSSVKTFYFNNSITAANKKSFVDGLIRFISDGFFFYPQIKMLEIITPKVKNPNYFYQFGYRGPLSFYSNLANNSLDVGHGDDLMSGFNLTVLGTTISDVNLTATQIALSKQVVELWTSFAITNKPTSSSVSGSNIWSPYTTKNGEHLRIGNIDNNQDPTIKMSNEFYTDRMNFWKTNVPIIKT